MSENGPAHVPVLLDRVLALFEPALDTPDAILVDTTLGLGGHSAALLAAHPELTLVGLDRDPDALARSRERLAEYGDRVHLVHAVYDELPDVLTRLGIPAAGRGHPRVRVRAGRAAGHADGPDRRADGRRGAEHVPAR